VEERGFRNDAGGEGGQKAEGSSCGPGTTEGGKNDIASRAQRRKNLPGGISPYLEGYCLLHARRTRARARAHFVQLRVVPRTPPFTPMARRVGAAMLAGSDGEMRPHPVGFSPTGNENKNSAPPFSRSRIESRGSPRIKRNVTSKKLNLQRDLRTGRGMSADWTFARENRRGGGRLIGQRRSAFVRVQSRVSGTLDPARR